MSYIQGGNFWSGFAAGAFASIASSLFTGGTDTTTGLNGELLAVPGTGFGGAGSFSKNLGGLLAFGSISGGVGAVIEGGNFWQGAVTGLVVSGLNHAMHPSDNDDNGYDKNGKQINKNGGDKTDIMYNDDGSVYSTTKVIESGDRLADRGYGFKRYQIATGACSEDNTIFDWYAGGKVLGLVGKGFNTLTGGLKQWVRIGGSYSIEGGFKTVSVRWGAGGKFWQKIGNETLQDLNRTFRQYKIPVDSWRTADTGHFHLWKP